jgi:hypothetical protein
MKVPWRDNSLARDKGHRVANVKSRRTRLVLLVSWREDQLNAGYQKTSRAGLSRKLKV